MGQFAVSRGVVDSGPATLSIRPESIELGAAKDATNAIPGRIISHVYMGTHTRFKVMVKDHLLQVVAEPQAIHKFREGEEVKLRFAPEQIWVLPQQ